ASSLNDVFLLVGHEVKLVDNRDDALKIDNIEAFDLVITDLDVDSGNAVPESETGDLPVCLPESIAGDQAENIKAFKICASNFRREEFNEEELKHLFETILDYKIKFVDRSEYVKALHENIEFELPSALSLMNVILDYLMKRVEKLGVISPEKSRSEEHT